MIGLGIGGVMLGGSWAGPVSAVIGVAFVQQPGVDGINPAALVVIGVSLFTALAMMGLHKLKHLDPRAVVAHFSGVSTICCLGALLFIPAAPTEANATFELRHGFALAGVAPAISRPRSGSPCSWPSW